MSYFSSAVTKYGIRNMEMKWKVEYGIGNIEYGIWNMEYGDGVWNMEMEYGE